MLVRLATEPGREDRANEDFTAATPTAAVLLDGAGIPDGVENGCVHGVAWFARRLGAALLAEISETDGRTLVQGLAAAIDGVRVLHEDTCDLEHAGSPSATVVAVRRRGDELEYLVLSDSILVLDLPQGPLVISDARQEDVGRRHRGDRDSFAIGSPEHAAALRTYVETLTSYRNRDGGFWVASTDPCAAEHAYTGSVPLADVRAVVLLSDGAGRLVDRFALATWPELVSMARQGGPGELLRRVRAAEAADPDGVRRPRGKARDDATAVVCTFDCDDDPSCAT